MARKDPSPNERYNTTDCVRGTQRKTGQPLISPVRARGGPRTQPSWRERHLLNRCVRHRRG